MQRTTEFSCEPIADPATRRRISDEPSCAGCKHRMADQRKQRPAPKIRCRGSVGQNREVVRRSAEEEREHTKPQDAPDECPHCAVVAVTFLQSPARAIDVIGNESGDDHENERDQSQIVHGPKLARWSVCSSDYAARRRRLWAADFDRPARRLRRPRSRHHRSAQIGVNERQLLVHDFGGSVVSDQLFEAVPRGAAPM